MRSADIFDICLERVQQYQQLASRVSAIRPDACAKDGPPQVGNPLAEYVADFDRCGQRALERWPQRRRAFRLYYVGGLPYRHTIVVLKVKPGTFDWWCYEIKRAVGPELARAGLFPPRKYREKTPSDTE